MASHSLAPPARELAARRLAGFRVLRSLARDGEAEVLLGHRMPDSDDSDAVLTVAIKVSPSTAERWRAVMHECAALERARGDHVIILRDVDADEASIRLIFERLPGGDLAELLRRRDRLDAGEAVTLLAPLASTLLRLHAAGVAHGAVSPKSVMFRDDGAPTLIGFSSAELFEAAAPEVVLESIGSVQRDREAARGLATTVLARTGGSREHAARALLADLEGCDAELVLPLLLSRLFDVAAATPLRFAPDDEDPDITSRTLRAVPVAQAVFESAAGSQKGSSRTASLLGSLVPESFIQRLSDALKGSWAAPVVGAVTRVIASRWQRLSPGRRRAALALAAAVLTVTVISVVVPASGAASSVRSPAGSNSRSAAAGPRGTPSAGTTDSANETATTADDPATAAVALLRARQRCFDSLSVLCLEGVDAAGSGALEDDQAVIRAAQRGDEVPDARADGMDSGSASLVQRLGDSALVSLNGAVADPASTGAPVPSSTPTRRPASLLLVKGEAGWRIRDVIAAGGETG